MCVMLQLVCRLSSMRHVCPHRWMCFVAFAPLSVRNARRMWRHESGAELPVWQESIKQLARAKRWAWQSATIKTAWLCLALAIRPRNEIHSAWVKRMGKTQKCSSISRNLHKHIADCRHSARGDWVALTKVYSNGFFLIKVINDL